MRKMVLQMVETLVVKAKAQLQEYSVNLPVHYMLEVVVEAARPVLIMEMEVLAAVDKVENIKKTDTTEAPTQVEVAVVDMDQTTFMLLEAMEAQGLQL